MLLSGSGKGTFDFHVEKGEAIHASEDGPIEIEDWDWNEWYVWARASLNASAEIDVRTRDDQEFEISVEALEPP